MKKISFLVLLVALLFISCKKETAKCPYTAPVAKASQAEIDSIQRYVNINDPSATKYSDGVFYKISNPGSGTSPTVCSDITVKYSGFIFNNSSPFDSSPTPVKFSLGSLIAGWQNVLYLLKPGGSITLYIPPSLGYGSRDVKNNAGVTVIPANSYLKFTIDLVEVQ